MIKRILFIISLTVSLVLPYIVSAQETGQFIGSVYATSNIPSKLNTDNVHLVLDSGAVKNNVEISVVEINKTNTADIPDNMQNVTAANNCYRMLPNGQRFERDITIAIKYDSTQLPYGYTEEDIFTFFYNEDTKLWQQIERDSIDTQKQLVYSHTNHFTDYINGILMMPENSDAIAYTPTSIKDLKAVDPMNGITLIAPPEANNKGTANLIYSLNIPAGRRGMQPNLNISYNSADGGGWLGLGWSLNISGITIETRWGVPLYDKDKESETYLLDGETLVTSYKDSLGRVRLNKPTYSHSYESRFNEDVVFYRRVEGAFQKIIRHGNNTKTYWWEVIDRDGTKYIYGRSDNSRIGDYKGNIAKWYLERVEDTYSNTILYTYEKRIYKESVNNNVFGEQVLLKNIRYTGNDSIEHEGRYDVEFIVSDINKYDATTSGIFGYKETDAWLLDRIDIRFDQRVIKSYYFGYKQGAFGKTLLCNIIETYPIDIIRNRSLECLNSVYEQDINNEEIVYCEGCDSDSTLDKYTHSQLNPSIRENTYIEKYNSIKGTLPITDNIVSNDIYNRCRVVDKCEYYVYNEHSFEYEEMPGNLFEPTYFIKNKNNVKDIIKGSLFGYKEYAGALETTKTKSWNVGFGLDIGFGYNTFLKTASMGGNISYAKENSEGINTLVDLNGDGYLDKIYKKDDILYYRLRNISNDREFLEEHQIVGSSEFLRARGTNTTWGLEGNVGSSFGVDFGVNWHYGNNSTDIYFCDVNGDRLPDLVRNEKVYYNKILEDSLNIFQEVPNNADYIITLDGCENSDTIYTGYPIEKNIYNSYICDTIKILRCETMYVGIDKDAIDTCYEVDSIISYEYPRSYEPNLENVRIWVVPYTGSINIRGIAKMKLFSEFMGDGVKIKIQKNEVNYLTDSLDANDSIGKSINIQNLLVSKGDTLFFRLLSKNSRMADRVEWNPNIKYTSVSMGIDLSDSIDANGINMFEYNYGEDFLLSGKQIIQIPLKSNIETHTDITVPNFVNLTDTVFLKIYKNNEVVHTLQVSNTTKNYSDNIIALSVDKGDSIQVMMSCFGTADWSNIEARCRMIIVENTSVDEDSLIVCIDSLTNKNNARYYFDYYPIINKEIYNYHQIPGKKIGVNKLQTNSISPRLGGVSNLTKVKITIKGTDGYYWRKTFRYNNSNVFYFTPTSDSVYVDYYIDDYTISNLVTNAQARINNSSSYVQCGLYSKYDTSFAKFGCMYRNWGQFAYKKDGDTLEIINTSLLKFDDIYNLEQSDISNYSSETDSVVLSDMNNVETNAMFGDNAIYTPLSSSFFYMQADFQNNCWRAYSDYAYIERNLLSNTPHPCQNMTIAENDAIIYESSVPICNNNTKISSKNAHTNSFGITGKVSFLSFDNDMGIGGSRTSTKIRQTTDMMDLNGDGYPDAVSETKVHYSQSQGGLSENNIGFHGLDGNYIDLSTTHIKGGNFGGSYIRAIRNISNNLKTSSISIFGGCGTDISSCNSISYGEYGWTDINGDGLLDKIVRKGDNIYYYQNIGYSFLPKVLFPNDTKEYHRSNSYGLSGSTNITNIFANTDSLIDETLKILNFTNKVNVSITTGLNLSKSTNNTQCYFGDMNGDGLPDKIEKYSLGFVVVYYNTGTNFNGGVSIYFVSKNDNESYTTDLTGALTMGVTIGFIPLKIEVNPKGGISRSLSCQKAQWIDMDNDGVVDYVWDAGGDSIGVKCSNLGKVNKLTKVHLATGGEYRIGYELSKADTRSNMRHYVMNNLIIAENKNNYPIKSVIYEYRNRVYDRYNRKDYGYDTVIAMEMNGTTNNYRKTIYSYHNQNYLFEGLCWAISIHDSLDNALVENIKDYKLMEINSGTEISNSNPFCIGDGYPAISSERTLYYENDSVRIITERQYQYGKYGNIERFTNMGDISDTMDNYVVVINYDTTQNNYIVSNVIDVAINNYRHRQATYNNMGDMSRLYIENTQGNYSEYSYDYDEFGNLTRLTFPENDSGQHLQIHYIYDTIINSLPISISNSYNYDSYIDYNYIWQKPIKTTDIGGSEIRYEYDKKGRLKTIFAPNEINSYTPTLRYEYYDESPNEYTYWSSNSGIWSRTMNYNLMSNNYSNYITTIMFADGLGGISCIKKSSSVDGMEKRIVSGRIDYDNLGRKIREYFPTEESLTLADSVIYNNIDENYTIFEYDVLDRNIATLFADATSITNKYSFANDFSGKKRFLTIKTDQNGHKTDIYTDARQLNTQINQHLTVNDFVITKFRYNILGETIETIDPENHSTYYDYDMIGRLIARTHPSQGTTIWVYDKVGNLTQQILTSGEFIKYIYNYNQLMTVNYSHRYWNNVYYEYGQTGSGSQTGHITKRQDATGVQDFRYDCMGNIIENRHTYIVPNTLDVFTLTTLWTYDSWSRIRDIIYPDKEIVTYHYDEGGNLSEIIGSKGEQTNRYLYNITYNKYNQRVSETKGNGIQTNYEYNPLNNRLLTIRDQLGTTIYQDVSYRYDNIGNITNINSIGLHSKEQRFEYDNINRLTSSNGTWDNLFYKTSLSYSKTGKIVSKNMSSTRLNNISSVYSVDYNNTYNYNFSNNPYAISNIVDNTNENIDFYWDDKGNMIHSEDHINHIRKDMCWTEDNRLQAFREFEENNIAAYYNYDAQGNRNLKLISPQVQGFQNTASFAQNPNLIFPTLYASPLITLTRYGYTKHYFEESRRICSQIGGGFALEEWNNIVNRVQEIKDNYENLIENQINGITETFSNCMQADVVINNDCNLFSMMYEQRERDAIEYPFYYHSDHLGSTTYLTDRNGNTTQTLAYLPYGEDWVDITAFQPNYNNLFDTTMLETYSFNGKEKDYESGFHYYGARYYASELGIWLSVDPMSDKYPSLSPYAYCADNPVKFIDPNGEEMTDFKNEKGKLIKHIDDGSNAVFQIVGKLAQKYYAFIEYDIKQGGTNTVNIQTAIQEQQIMNNDNFSLSEQKGTTFCNFATQNIMNTIASIYTDPSIVIKGRANNMADELIMGENYTYVLVSEKEAIANAKKGGLSLVVYRNPNNKRSGHIATYSVGDNISKGQIANIGPKIYSGFVPLNKAISSKKKKNFFIFTQPSVPPITITP
jgi:RHS repeat-associated protein